MLCCVVVLQFLTSCQSKIQPLKLSPETLPAVILWSWERPENLEFLDSNKYGVAFLAQTLILQNETIVFRPRRQPLKVNAKTKLIAVTRIESAKVRSAVSALSVEQQTKIVEFVLKTLEMTNVAAIQVDFDATISERDFYQNLLIELKQKLPPGVPLSITALASFCIGDRWLSDLPIDEAVPMIFRMGADNAKIKGFLANGNDFAEPLCQLSYGIATDEPLQMNFRLNRRLYVFNERAWRESDLERLPPEFR